MRQQRALLDDGDQHVGGDRDPDLRLHRVLAGAEECLDAQMLFDSFEEQFDLPAQPVQLADRLGRQPRVVGQEHDALVV